MIDLARRLPGGEHVVGVDVEHTDSGTTSRARLHLTWDEEGHPATVFVKRPAEGLGARVFGTFVGLGATEACFYRDIRSRHDLPAPGCHLAEAGRRGRFVIVLDDLAAEGATFPTVADGTDLEGAEAVLVALAQTHAELWDSPRFDADLAWVNRPSRNGVRRKAERRMLRTAVRTACRRFPDELGGEVGELLEEADRRGAALDAHRDQPPVTLLHGDTHLGNTYRFPDGRAGLFDWQVIQRGPGIRDVAYFLVLSLPSELRAQCESKLLNRYLDELGRRGVDPPADDVAWDQYRLYAIDALHSAVFTAAMGDRLQPEQQWRTGLDRAVAAVRALGTLDELRNL